MFCIVLQCHVAVCCSVLQCVAVCCSVLQCVAVCCNVLQCVAVCCIVLQCVGELQYVAVCCSVVMQCVAVSCNVLQRAAACCSVLQCRYAVCCSILQCVAVCYSGSSIHISSAKKKKHKIPYVTLMVMVWLSFVGSLNDRSLLQNIVSFIRLFSKRDIRF